MILPALVVGIVMPMMYSAWTNSVDGEVAGMKTLVLKISGMTCDHCVQAVSRNLQLTPGVRGASVDLLSHSARVEMNDETCSLNDVVASVQRAGFQVDGFEFLEAAG